LTLAQGVFVYNRVPEPVDIISLGIIEIEVKSPVLFPGRKDNGNGINGNVEPECEASVPILYVFGNLRSEGEIAGIRILSSFVHPCFVFTNKRVYYIPHSN